MVFDEIQIGYDSISSKISSSSNPFPSNLFPEPTPSSDPSDLSVVTSPEALTRTPEPLILDEAIPLPIREPPAEPPRRYPLRNNNQAQGFEICTFSL